MIGPRAVALGVLAAVGLVACGSGEEGLTVADAWTRPSPPGASDAAIYLTIENHGAGDDRLIGSTSDRCLVMHPHLTAVDDRGVASMTSVDELAVPGDGRLDLEPNGLHLMCLGLGDRPFRDGETFDVEVSFRNHDPVTVTVSVAQR